MSGTTVWPEPRAEPVSCDDVGSLARRLSPPLHGLHSVSVPWPANVQLRAAGTLSQAYSWRNELALVGRFRPRNARRPAHISGPHGAAVQEFSVLPTNRLSPLFRLGARVGAPALESPSNTSELDHSPPAVPPCPWAEARRTEVSLYTPTIKSTIRPRPPPLRTCMHIQSTGRRQSIAASNPAKGHARHVVYSRLTHQ